MIRNKFSSIFMMTVSIAMTLTLQSLSHARSTGGTGSSGLSTEEPCANRTMQELQDAVCQLMKRKEGVQAQLAQTQSDLLAAQADLVESQTGLSEARDALDSARTRLSTAQGEILALDADIISANLRLDGLTQGIGLLQERVVSFEASHPVLDLLEPYISIDHSSLDGLAGPHVLFTGANVHVRSGSGATDDGGALTGLGNLIVGYDEANGDTRTGSHNLVIGRSHTFTSFGGLVAGFDNTVTGQEASITAGRGNTAKGAWSSVSGGLANNAVGSNSSVTAGSKNSAVGQYASVTGGTSNVALSEGASVCGGHANVAGDLSGSGKYSVVSGGWRRTLLGDYDWRAGELWQDQ